MADVMEEMMAEPQRPSRTRAEVEAFWADIPRLEACDARDYVDTGRGDIRLLGWILFGIVLLAAAGGAWLGYRQPTTSLEFIPDTRSTPVEMRQQI